MYARNKSVFGVTFILLLIFLAACEENKQPVPTSEIQIKSTSVKAENKIDEVTEKQPEKKPVLATITAPDYIVEIHQAIAFLPKDDDIDLMKVKKGYRYVVLDMSVKNTSKIKEVDFGQILLSSKVKDEKGKEYNMNAMAIAAYTLDNPDPQHQAQYNAMWNKLMPGDTYRATAYGLEVPEDAKNFVISLKEDGELFKKSKQHEARFTVE